MKSRVHEAGELVNGIQVCVYCGEILTDYRGAMVPDGTPPLLGFAPGAKVEVTPGWPKQSIVVDRPADCDEL
jgi:hypothetical protein